MSTYGKLGKDDGKQGTGKGRSPDLIHSHRQLEVFQEAYDLAIRIHKTSLSFPRMEQHALADQLRRSTKSVCAYIAEGFANQRGSKTEWKKFVLMALGACAESTMWLDFCRDLGYITHETFALWQQELDNISIMLHKMRNA